MEFNYPKFENEIACRSNLYSKWNQQFIDDLSDIKWSYPTFYMDRNEYVFSYWCREPRKRSRCVSVIFPIDDRPIRIEMDKKASVELCEMFAEKCMDIILLLKRYGVVRDGHT